jgi:hypothetical protein
MFIKITNVQQGSLPTMYLDQDCIISLTPINYGINSDGSTKNYCVVNYSVGNAVATAVVAHSIDVVAEYCLYVEQNYYNVDKFAQIKSLDEFVSDKDRLETCTLVFPPQKFQTDDSVRIINKDQVYFFGREGYIQEVQQNIQQEGGAHKRIVNRYYVSVPTSLHDGHYVWFQEWELELLPPSPQETPQCNGNGKAQSKEE